MSTSSKKMSTVIILIIVVVAMVLVAIYIGGLDGKNKEGVWSIDGKMRQEAVTPESKAVESVKADSPKADASNKTATSSPTSVASIPGLKECGITEGKPIDRGFVFVDGRYIEAPYTVSRKGAYFFINDVEVGGDYLWPYPKFDIDHDPGLPTSITEKTTFEDIDKGKYEETHYIKKYVYLSAKYVREYGMKDDGPAKAQEKLGEGMAEYFRQYPCVKEAIADEKKPGRVIVKFRDGYVFKTTFQLIPPYEPWSGFMTDAGYAKNLDMRKEQIEELLREGKWLMFYREEKGVASGPHFSEANAFAQIPLITEIIQSNMSRKEKEIKILLACDLCLGQWIDNFKPNKQLAERLAALQSAYPDIKPMTMADIPTVEQWEAQRGQKISEFLRDE